ncbi:hypothetical protein [Streptomyces sp. NPDC012756]|uniref:hypothetical protein n=1 Tax=Streptomyces sp. NPDC012756 TaxID=3364847 RepID=UPI0036889012
MENGTEHDHSHWEEVVRAARERARSRQALMIEHHGLSGDVQLHSTIHDLKPTVAEGC